MTPWNRFHVHEYQADELRDLLVQVFPEVRVRGLFGTPTLYETEIRRVDAARQRIRRKNEAARRADERRAAAAEALSRAGTPRAERPARPLPIRVARRVLPPVVRRWLRSVLGRPPAPASTVKPNPPAAPPMPETSPAETPAELSLEAFLEFSVADLFYADTDLDRAMDLLAVCRVGEAPGPS
jgi:hypothetical protein